MLSLKLKNRFAKVFFFYIIIEYHGILERLNSFDRTKTSVLRIELEDMNSDLKAMKKLYEQFTTLSGGNSIQFLLTSRKIYEEIVSLVEKPINGNSLNRKLRIKSRGLSSGTRIPKRPRKPFGAL